MAHPDNNSRPAKTTILDLPSSMLEATNAPPWSCMRLTLGQPIQELRQWTMFKSYALLSLSNTFADLAHNSLPAGLAQ